MKYYQLIFSPTGGTERVSKAVTQTWPQVDTIDLSNPHTDYAAIAFDKNSLVLIAMPSFGGVAPQLALERLSMIHGNGAVCAIAAVYGNRAYEDTLVQMEDYAQNAGFQVIAAISAVAEHSIIHEYAAGRPNENDCNELARFGNEILKKAAACDFSKPSVPGSRPYKNSGTGMVPKAGSNCNACGLCAQKCPADAISAAAPRVTDKNRCISCMRCVTICPNKSRKVSSVMAAIAAAAIKKACSVEKANELFV